MGIQSLPNQQRSRSFSWPRSHACCDSKLLRTKSSGECACTLPWQTTTLVIFEAHQKSKHSPWAKVTPQPWVWKQVTSPVPLLLWLPWALCVCVRGGPCLSDVRIYRRTWVFLNHYWLGGGGNTEKAQWSCDWILYMSDTCHRDVLTSSITHPFICFILHRCTYIRLAYVHIRAHTFTHIYITYTEYMYLCWELIPWAMQTHHWAMTTSRYYLHS